MHTFINSGLPRYVKHATALIKRFTSFEGSKFSRCNTLHRLVSESSRYIPISIFRGLTMGCRDLANLSDHAKRCKPSLPFVILGFSLLSASLFAQSVSSRDDVFRYPFYIGAVGGWGSTTWQGLVPSEENQNLAMSISTPMEVQEGGGVWGLSAGYELTRFFAFEANYMDFPDAVLTFDQDSFFAFEQDGLTALRTHTQTASLIAKVMLVLPKTSMRIFSGAGVASVWRRDDVNSNYRISPTFAFGVNMNITEHLMGEVGTTYTAGYGEPEINPTKDFVPFLYSFFVKAALRF